jgi:phenylalanyl-tRNA synthetase beta chain
MGGRDSEVAEGTTDLLLEVAYFDPRRVRASRKRAGVSTDASYRFERGVDRAATLDLLRDAASLLVAVAGGMMEAILDVGAAPGALAPVRLRAARVARVLGHRVADAEIERVLSAVGFALTRDAGVDDAVWTAVVPAWRHDVTLEVDLVEEVARLVGFDALPDDLRPFRPGTVPDHPLVSATRRVREALVADGLYEARRCRSCAATTPRTRAWPTRSPPTSRTCATRRSTRSPAARSTTSPTCRATCGCSRSGACSPRRHGRALSPRSGSWPPRS